MKKKFLAGIVAALVAFFMICPVSNVGADSLIFSLSNTTVIDGVTYDDMDLIQYDFDNNELSLYYDMNSLLDGTSSDLDAVHLTNNGEIIFSTSGDPSKFLSTSGVSFPYSTFDDADLIKYNPTTNVATRIFDGEFLLFDTASDEDIDAVYVKSNGNIILSTTHSTSLKSGGPTWEDKDLVEYNPLSSTATIIFDGSLLTGGSGDTDVNAVGMLPDGTILLSVTNGRTIAGVWFDDKDLVAYDTTTSSATLFFKSDDHGISSTSDTDIDAAYYLADPVPEPATMLLLGSGLIGLAGFRRQKFKK